MNPVRNRHRLREKVSGGVKITVKNFQKKIPINPQILTAIRRAALKAWSLEGIRGKSPEFNICFVNNKKIAQLNLRYLRKKSPTDVIAFDLSADSNTISADIVISTDAAISNSKIFKTAVLDELFLYLIHGILHLLGYDDKDASMRKIMQKKTERILTSLNIRYRDVAF